MFDGRLTSGRLESHSYKADVTNVVQPTSDVRRTHGEGRRNTPSARRHVARFQLATNFSRTRTDRGRDHDDQTRLPSSGVNVVRATLVGYW